MAARKSLSLREAADILGIGDAASISQIRIRYHTLVRQWHPDVSEYESEETHNGMVRLNEAYEVLIEYCMRYEIPLSDEEQVPGADKGYDRDWMDQYGHDPIWGHGESRYSPR
ncbi:J domain-containing protein [Methanocalculus taiwanensis]|nr:J domain-containing protein [Methanocalculus taiwanensis]